MKPLTEASAVASMLLLLVTATAAQTPAPRGAGSEIVTSGSGEVTLSPQRALLRIGVTTHAQKAGDASTQNAQTLNAVLDALARAGVPRDSLQTVAFGVGPNYDYESGKRLIDYQAYAAVRLTARDLPRIGGLIDIALGAGATDIGSIGFESDSMDIARQRALALAFGKARADAEALARAAGGSLGRLLAVRTRGGYFPEFEMAELRMASSGYEAGTPITPRDVVVQVAVETRWVFAPRAR